jgi:hypothetical protein
MLNLTLKYKINLQNHKYCVLCCSFKKVSEEEKTRQGKKMLIVKVRQVLWTTELEKRIGF